ncbi:MAG: hypothetical protein LBQ03_02805 [Puniceicoccales bacterium]|jgi:hypothetical protein|nr:hypothetical protein [Puniceicoccales bacterium]
MNKLQKLELLLMASIVTPSIGLANDFYSSGGKEFETIIGENSNLQMQKFSYGRELNSDLMFDIISQIIASEMKEKVRSRLLKRLQSGEVSVLKNSKALSCILIEKERCIFIEDGKFLDKEVFRKAKFFPINSRLFEEIKICIFDSENNSGTQKIMRKAKRWAWDGSKWILVEGVPVLANCCWSIFKHNPKTVIGGITGYFACKKVYGWGKRLWNKLNGYWSPESKGKK